MSGTLLIVDDVATNRIVLKVKLANARYTVLQAASAREALELSQSQRPDLILLDMQLPDLAGVELVRQLRAVPATALLPIIAVSAAPDPVLRLEALRAGAEEVMTKPLDDLVLLARIRALLRARETDEEHRLREATTRDLGFEEPDNGFSAQQHIALIAAQTSVAVGWKHALAQFLPNAQLSVLTRDTALTLSHDSPPPDAFLVAADLSRPGDGLRFMSELRSRARTRHSAICIALPEGLRETAAFALDLGANDLLPVDLHAPHHAEEAALRLSTQIARKRTLDRHRAAITTGLRLAAIDPLTRLYNRRYALPHLHRIATRAHETGRQFAVMMIDIDHFKAVNDTYGHGIGDRVLAEVANRLHLNMRGGDMVARVGGEEFLVVMPDTSPEIASMVADRLLRVINTHPVTVVGLSSTQTPEDIPVTISIGLAIGSGTEDSGVTFDRADAALLKSKAGGRNRVTVAE